MIGNKIGRWTIINGPILRTEYGRQTKWYFCRCECGTEKKVRANSLQQKRTQSCGCLRTERLHRGINHHQYKHGHTINGKRSKEWRTWNSMIRRCTYPSMDDYERYGGKGIKVCKRWRNSFEAFLDDVGYSPSQKHSIDRIDNDGNYEPGNVRWATPSEQTRNSSKARFITFEGKTLTMGEWAKNMNINRQTIQMRIDHYGWSVHNALTKSVRRRK